MTIASAIQTKQQQVVAAYTACNGKGATIPQTQDLTNLATCIASIQTGGGGDHGGEYAVTVIDYDGSVIMQDHLDTGATFTLPDAPTHSRLTFQDWAAPVNITNNTITVGKSDITIGAVYTPTSGVNEFDIVLTPVTGKTVNLRMIGSRDWGDGTTENYGGVFAHTYADNLTTHTVTINGITKLGESAFENSGIKKVQLNNGITKVPRYCFRENVDLNEVVLPNSINTIDDYAFELTMPNRGSVTGTITTKRPCRVHL